MFPASGTKSKPLRMNVNGRKERRAACILSADMMHYEVLDIDNQDGSEEED
jgi:anaphase-promoting complex subunit 4